MAADLTELKSATLDFTNQDEVPVVSAFSRIDYFKHNMPFNLHPALSCCLCKTLKHDLDMSQRLNSTHGGKWRRRICHLAGKYLICLCGGAGSSLLSFQENIASLRWLTLYVDRHKHCAVSLNGERVHLCLCAPLQSMAAHSYCCGLCTES